MKSIISPECVRHPRCMSILFFLVVCFSCACQGKNVDSQNTTSLSGSLPFHKLRVESGAKSTVIGTDTIIPIEMKESYRVVSSFHLIVDTISVGISNSFLLIILDYLHNLALAKENAWIVVLVQRFDEARNMPQYSFEMLCYVALFNWKLDCNSNFWC